MAINNNNAQTPTNPRKLVPIMSKSGVKRDGTQFDNLSLHTDSLWCRWQRGRARKMRGYKMISNQFTYPSRGCFGYTRDGQYFFNSGTNGNLEVQRFDPAGNGESFIDRTPAGFVNDPNNMWQFDIQYDAVSNNANLIAHAAPNLTDIDSSTQQLIYYGDAFANTPLMPIAASQVAGGAVSLYPYLFGLDADGGVIWSVVNTPSDMTGIGSGSARVTGRKIICGRGTRGGPGVNPAGLLFALDAIVRVTFSGGSTVFNFDRIASKGYSILSSQCVVEYDSIYYWPGQDRFLSFNGVVQELPCNTHTNFFFDNLNFAQRQKVRGTYNPRWGEIQWLAPLFGATECNWMLIYNVREQTWYDTPLSRIMGEHNEVFPNPVLFDNTESGDGKTQLWMHDFGTDQINGQSVQAVQSFYQTELYTALSPILQNVTGGDDVTIRVSQIMPDFRNQSGDLKITLTGQKYAQSDPDEFKILSCPPKTEKLDFQFQSRMFTIKVESNVAGGDFEAGMPMMLVQKGSVRP